jgi:hypothetical protein
VWQRLRIFRERSLPRARDGSSGARITDRRDFSQAVRGPGGWPHRDRHRQRLRLHALASLLVAQAAG